MADNDAAFNSLKMEIRSILMPFQKGCNLQEFRKEYKSFLGRDIPAAKFNYPNDVDLLFDIPDVVEIYQIGRDYHLNAVADETTLHLKEMVSKQKPLQKKKSKATLYNKYPYSQYTTRSNQSSRSSYANRPSYTTRSPYSSRPPSNFSRPYSSARPSSLVSRPSSVTSNHTSIVNDSGFASRPAFASRPVSNSSTFASAVRRPVDNNPPPLVSRPSSTASNYVPLSMNSSVSNPPPLVSRPSSTASNYVPLSINSSVSNLSSFTSRPQSSAVVNPSANPSLSASRQTTETASASSSFATSGNRSVVGNHDSSLASGNPAQARSSSNPAATNSNSRQFQKNLPPRFRTTTSPAKLLALEDECKIVDVVRKHPTGIRARDFPLAFQRYYNQQFSFESHGFQSLQECLETITVLSMKPLSNNDFTIYYSGVKQTQQTASGASADGKLLGLDSCSEPASTFKKDKAPETFKFNASWAAPAKVNISPQLVNGSQGHNQNAWSCNGEPAVFETSSTEDNLRARKPKADALDTFESPSLGLTEDIRNNFRKIMSANKHGIWAKEFPTIYEETTKSRFDLHRLGFTDLAGLVDYLPDIFRRKNVAGSRNDWIIAPVGGCDEEKELKEDYGRSVKVIDLLKESIRQILQGYAPEGIPLNEFLQVYSINCNEPLHIADIGFSCIEDFLLYIASEVPLKIELEEGRKTVFLDGSVEVLDALGATSIPEEVFPESLIPIDASSPDCQYKKLDLPLDFGTNTYVYVYTSHILNPNNLFIQFVGPDTSVAMSKLYDEMDEFYHGPQSEFYCFQDQHLREGAMCAALWTDNHWYRAIILSVLPQEAVKVNYVDWGTKDIVTRNQIRYLKEPFTKLPAQAVNVSLAYCYNPKWDLHVTQMMLQLCNNTKLLARLEDEKDGKLFIILCLKTEESEIYINDFLVAHSTVANIQEQLPGTFQPQTAFDPTLVVQSQYYNQIQNALLQTMSSQEAANLMQAISFKQPANHLVPNSSALLPSSSGGLAVPPMNNSPAQQTYAGTRDAYQLPLSAAAYQLPLDTEDIQAPINGMADVESFRRAASLHTPPGFSSAHRSASRKVDNNLSTAAYHLPLSADAYQKISPPSSFLPLSEAPAYATAAANYSTSPSAAVGLSDQSGYGSDEASEVSSIDGDEIFEDDDDDVFNEFLAKCSIVTKRYVKRIQTNDDYCFHILIVDERLYISSGDLSILIWSNLGPDHLLEKLQSREDVTFTSRSITREGKEEMFDQFERFYVKGIQRGSRTSCIIIYPLISAIAILNTYGHPSLELRQEIRSEMTSFNPNHPAWQELAEGDIPDTEVEPWRPVTDDEKLRRLCMHDLLTMQDGIRIKRSILIRERDTNLNVEEFDSELGKLERMMLQVELRKTQITRIISMFST